MLNRALLVIALAALTSDAAAQRPRERGREEGVLQVAKLPKWFATIGTGIQWGVFLVDDRSATSWDFDGGFALRGTLEREVAPQFSVGAGFNYARLPLTITTFPGAQVGCGRCAADATVTSYGATMRYATGRGGSFRQVVEGFAGALRYGNFSDTQGTNLGIANTDFAFGAGYGFGFQLAPDWHLQLVQDGLYSVHERSELGQGGGRIVQHYTTRLTLRVGF